MDEYHSAKGLLESKDGCIIFIHDEGLYQYGSALLPYKPDKPNPKKKPSNKRKKGEQKSKREILYEASPFCKYCNKPLAFNSFTLDHVVPKSKGGTNALSNLVVSCYDCNNLKGSRDLEHFLQLLAKLNEQVRENVD